MNDAGTGSGPTRVIEPLTAAPDVTVALPGSKSLTNRALIAAALAEGTSRIEGALLADDTEAMVDCLSRLGVAVRVDREAPAVEVDGTAGHPPGGPAELDARLSGTTSRFMLPLLALGSGRYRLDGAPPLRARPMDAVLDGLRQLGATVEEEGAPGQLPVTVVASGLEGGTVRIAGDASSQSVSGLLLSAPAMRRGLRVEVATPLVSRPYVEMTAAVMAAFGAPVETGGGQRFTVAPARYRARSYRVEPDASAASYFFAAAAICGGRVRIEGLGAGSLQGDVGFVDVLEAMGATVERTDSYIEVRGSAELRGVEVDLADLSDTAQTLAAVAVFASSPTRLTGIGFIRRKETDRIGHTVRELRRCGIDAREEDDGFVVHPGTPRHAVVQTYDDHRMAMSFALIGLRIPGIEIADPGCVAKTFPGFFETLEQLRSSGSPAGR